MLRGAVAGWRTLQRKAAKEAKAGLERAYRCG